MVFMGSQGTKGVFKGAPLQEGDWNGDRSDRIMSENRNAETQQRQPFLASHSPSYYYMQLEYYGGLIFELRGQDSPFAIQNASQGR